MHKAVFENGFFNNAHAIGHAVHGGELCLHIGGECGVWCGSNIHRFRAAATHIQGDAIAGGANMRAGFLQFQQHRIHILGARAAASDFATSHRSRH